jgi:hypothetical protein
MARKIKRDAVLNREHRNRVDREVDDRVGTQDRELSDDERVEMLRMSVFQSALPDLPKLKGYHVCWLTTTNPRDPIVRREQLGYQLIRASELPGWDYAGAPKGAEYEGCVMVNEMIAAKIRNDLYQRFMSNNHHEQPLYEEEKLVVANQQKQQEAMQYGARVIEGKGNTQLGKDPGAPNFSAPPVPSRPPAERLSGDNDFISE